ncbi:MAG: hypothetical protein M0002_20350 [Rhodospirillales bacterium]|nr:hypothetical protein [Rhodospirillales bacterium]
MNTTADRLSRWTPSIFACALVNLALGLLLAISGLAWPETPAGAPATLAMVHLLTIGWLMLLMLGALFQFVPVITGRKLPSQWFALATLVGVELGLASMVCGFLALGGNALAAVLLPIGGSVVVIAVLTGGAALLVPLMRKRPRPLSAWFILAGLAFLLLTVLLGLTFAFALTVPSAGPLLALLLASGVAYHVLAGLGGWFTLTAIGVSYELLPMFMLAPHERGRLGKAVLWLGAGGFAAALAAGLAGALWPLRWIGVPEQAGRLAIVLALALYLVDVARIYHDRRRRQIELHNRAAVGAFISLGFTVLLAAWAAAAGRLAAFAPVLVLLFLLGWLSGLGLTQLYKIVAFLSWLQRFGNRLGRAPVPRVQDLVNEQRAAGLFALYFTALGAAAVAVAFGQPVATRAALAVSLLAVLLLAREYARAWRGYYAVDRSSGPSSGTTTLSRIKGVHP